MHLPTTTSIAQQEHHLEVADLLLIELRLVLSIMESRQQVQRQVDS